MSQCQTPRDQAGITAFEKRVFDQLKTESTTAHEAFQDALEELMEFVAEDTIRSGTAIPGRGGCYDPDVSTRERLFAKAVDCAQAAFAPKPAPFIERRRTGVLVVHNPDERLATSRWLPTEGSPHVS